MLPPKQSAEVLVKMFRKKYIANLDELFDVLDTRSRMSVFRRLKPLGYLSSFTDAGGYYTLQDIPKFDMLGLWFYRDVGFSRAGTLKSTPSSPTCLLRPPNKNDVLLRIYLFSFL